jgi:tRNA(His) 5'-end guanylyltransferase
MKQENKIYKEIDGVKYEVRDNKYFYDGDLNIDKTNNGYLPDNLTISGHLYADNYDKNLELPKNLTVGEDLNLYNTPIKTLPSGLIVGGDLDADNCTMLKVIPDSLIVGGNLTLSNCTNLVELLITKVGGILDVENTKIKKLPDNLIVGDSLWLGYTNITALPNKITVGRSIDLNETPIEYIPNDIVIGENLILNKCKNIYTLPDNITIGNDLFIERSNIKTLPQNLTVIGDLFLYYYQNIKTLPDNIIVHGNVFADDSSINNTYVNKIIPENVIHKLNDLHNMVIIWERNNITYIKIGKLFTVIDSKYQNVYHAHVLGDDTKLYILTDGENHWAYGKTKEEAWIKLMYSIKRDHIIYYHDMRMNTKITIEDASSMFKIITNIFHQDMNKIDNPFRFIQQKYITLNDLYTLLKLQFGNDVVDKYINAINSTEQCDCTAKYNDNIKTLTAFKPIIITLNGVGFYKKLNQKIQKPFDSKFNKLMNETLIYLLENLPYTKVGYTWRYEMNIIINIPTYFNTNALWKRDVSKIQSIVASMASTFFTREYHELFQTENNTILFEFDCQTWNTPTVEDAYNWLVYRQEECIDNSIKRFARFFLTIGEMKGKTSEELIKYLIEHYNTNWNHEKADNKFGRIFIKEKVIQFDIDEKTNEQKVYGKEEWERLSVFFFTLKDEKIKEIIINEMNKTDE